MKKLISMAMFLTALAVLSWSAKAQENPESVVTNLYKADKAKAVSDMSKTELQKYFSKTLADDLWKAMKTERLDFAILYHTDDDSDIKNFRIGKAIKTDGTDLYATVPVTFINFGEKRRIEYKLGKGVGGNWRILDVIYHYKGETFTLNEVLNEGDN